MRALTLLVCLCLAAAAGLGCSSWASQIKGDLEAVMPQCTAEAAIVSCQCAARVLRERQCQRLKAEGKTGPALPPACRDDVPVPPAPASQAHPGTGGGK